MRNKVAFYSKIKLVEGVWDFLFGLPAHISIQLGGFAAAMAQQFLDNTDIGAVLQQMRCIAVPQGMHRCLLPNTRFLKCPPEQGLNTSG